jgi:hypothetical protein
MPTLIIVMLRILSMMNRGLFALLALLNAGMRASRARSIRKFIGRWRRINQRARDRCGAAALAGGVAASSRDH